jgi:hypothetical protein
VIIVSADLPGPSAGFKKPISSSGGQPYNSRWNFLGVFEVIIVAADLPGPLAGFKKPISSSGGQPYKSCWNFLGLLEGHHRVSRSPRSSSRIEKTYF